jgi:hypothetical protein
MNGMTSLRPPPFALRVAAILCCAVGFWSLMPAVVHGAQAIGDHALPWPAVAAPVLSALLVGFAGVLLWLRRRLGVVMLAVGGVLPAVTNAALGLPVRPPSVLMVVAAVLVLLNVRQLRHGSARN